MIYVVYECLRASAAGLKEILLASSDFVNINLCDLLFSIHDCVVFVPEIVTEVSKSEDGSDRFVRLRVDGDDGFTLRDIIYSLAESVTNYDRCAS